jgi:hypothetical protein
MESSMLFRFKGWRFKASMALCVSAAVASQPMRSRSLLKNQQE